MNNLERTWFIGEEFSHRRRSKIEIIFKILDFLAKVGRARKTHIMQYANLNSRSFKLYVEDTLLALNFLKKEEVDDKILYSITVYGMYVLTFLRLLASVNVFEDKKVSAGKAVYNAFLRKISNTLISLGLKYELVVDESEQGIAIMRIHCPESIVKLIALEKGNEYIALLETSTAMSLKDYVHSEGEPNIVFIVQLGDVQHNLYTVITQSTFHNTLENTVAVLLKSTHDIVQEGIEVVLKRLNCT